jgi:hypothetical protein
MKVQALLSKRGRSMIAIGAVATAIAINGLGVASAGAQTPPVAQDCETAFPANAQPAATITVDPAVPGTAPAATTGGAGMTADDTGTATFCASAISVDNAPTVSVNVCVASTTTSTQSSPAFEVVPDQFGAGATEAGSITITPGQSGAGGTEAGTTTIAPESGASPASTGTVQGGSVASIPPASNAGDQPSLAATTSVSESNAPQDGQLTATISLQDPAAGAAGTQAVPGEPAAVAELSPAAITSETQQTCISISIGSGGAIEIVPVMPGAGFPANGEAPADQGTSTGGVVTIPAQPGAGAPSTAQPGGTTQDPNSTPVPTR